LKPSILSRLTEFYLAGKCFTDRIRRPCGKYRLGLADSTLDADVYPATY
jgi:hypothetical protein